MFNTGIYKLPVLLLKGNITIGDLDRKVIYELEPSGHEDIHGYVTDTIGELCTNTNLANSTSANEQQQFVKWFHENINQVEELYAREVTSSV